MLLRNCFLIGIIIFVYFFLFCLAVNDVGKLKSRCYFVSTVVKARIIRFFKKKNVSLKVHSFLLILNGNERVTLST